MLYHKLLWKYKRTNEGNLMTQFNVTSLVLQEVLKEKKKHKTLGIESP